MSSLKFKQAMHRLRKPRQICRQWTAGSEAVVERYSMSLVIPSPLTVPFVDSPRGDEWLYGTPPPNNALERKFRTKNAR